MSGDSAAAAADFANALEDFADQAGAPGSPREVWVTIGTPHDVEQRTVPLPADLVDWITELVRDETQTLEAGHRAADRTQDSDWAQASGSAETWW